MVGVSRVLISKLEAAGPQFQLDNFAVGQIERFVSKESVTQSDDKISEAMCINRWRHAVSDKLYEAA